MKTGILTVSFMLIVTIIYAQTINSTVNNAFGDGPNIGIYNSNAANSINDPRASIWLDDDGKLKFRSVKGLEFAFRNISNTFDDVVIKEGGYVGIGTYTPNYKLTVAGGDIKAL
jgi:hypothetical protein